MCYSVYLFRKNKIYISIYHLDGADMNSMVMVGRWRLCNLIPRPASHLHLIVPCCHVHVFMVVLFTESRYMFGQMFEGRPSRFPLVGLFNLFFRYRVQGGFALVLVLDRYVICVHNHTGTKKNPSSHVGILGWERRDFSAGHVRGQEKVFAYFIPTG